MKADPTSLANYYRVFRVRLEKAGIGRAIWDLRAGFDDWDAERARPRPGLHEALFDGP